MLLRVIFFYWAYSFSFGTLLFTYSAYIIHSFKFLESVLRLLTTMFRVTRYFTMRNVRAGCRAQCVTGEKKEEAVRHNTLSRPPINIRPNAVKIYLRRTILCALGHVYVHNTGPSARKTMRKFITFIIATRKMKEVRVWN